jgi:hypothetical protein
MLSQRLDVRARHIVAGQGDASRTLTVYCPFRASSLALGDCVACHHCEGTTIDPIGAIIARGWG